LFADNCWWLYPSQLADLVPGGSELLHLHLDPVGLAQQGHNCVQVLLWDDLSVGESEEGLVELVGGVLPHPREPVAQEYRNLDQTPPNTLGVSRLQELAEDLAAGHQFVWFSALGDLRLAEAEEGQREL